MERLSSHGEMLSRVALERLDHSSFDMSKHNYLSGKLGKIIPARISEVYPGDTIKGRTNIVANFEPLAGPIMGSMVCKQESFFVPYSLLWRHAYKFFTGKNGFNEPMPTTSVKEIYQAYVSILQLSIFTNPENFYTNVSTYLSLSSYQEKLNEWTGRWYLPLKNFFVPSLKDFGERFGVLDLVQPLLDKFYYYFYNQVDYVVDTPSGELENSRFIEAWRKDQDANTDDNVIGFLKDFYVYVYNYLFGTSSMLDYMGVSIVDDWNDYFSIILKAAKESVKESPSFELPEHFYDIWSEIPINWLPFRAAYCVWYWNYRDQLLELDAYDPESDEFLDSSIDRVQLILFTLLRVRCWYKDTYTTSLTNTGSGNFGVPVSNDARQIGFYNGDSLVETSDAESAVQAGATTAKIRVGEIEYSLPINYLINSLQTTEGNPEYQVFPFVSLDLFDRVSRLRRFTRKELILGYEYDDVLWSNFRVRLSNVRMHVPELLDRGRDAVAINTIVNNTTTTEQVAGDKTAVAWAQGSSDGINYFVEEHGFYLHFFTIMPIQTYVGGMQRLFFKKERFDYMWPEFATMGMDAVYNFELASPLGQSPYGGLSDQEALSVFGYQGRYYDLKSEHDECHGNLRNVLSYMLFDRRFDSKNPPKLNYAFVHCWPRLDMFVTDDDSVDVIRTIDVHSQLDIYRTLPVESERV